MKKIFFFIFLLRWCKPWICLDNFISQKRFVYNPKCITCCCSFIANIIKTFLVVSFTKLLDWAFISLKAKRIEGYLEGYLSLDFFSIALLGYFFIEETWFPLIIFWFYRSTFFESVFCKFPMFLDAMHDSLLTTYLESELTYKVGRKWFWCFFFPGKSYHVLGEGYFVIKIFSKSFVYIIKFASYLSNKAFFWESYTLDTLKKRVSW